ncbi:hypothetical protein O3M35_004400 [Rhynocoris fuscipes]|uniref:Rab-GAP TBC domain-containing protein n=1 Tax=Rhynocoris fuscipes TaxID=488301 RepID=A0AAW1CH30_9HEMI
MCKLILYNICSRPSPRKEVKVVSTNNVGSSASFQDFQKSISDAWDLGDDEFCNITNIKISKKISQSAADSVINIHKHTYNGFSKQRPRISLNQCSLISDSDKNTDAGRAKIKKFQNLLQTSYLNLNVLQNLSWPGIPFPVRAETWRILSVILIMGYAPTCLDLREATLKQKRGEYWYFVKDYYYTGTRDDAYQGTYRQIHIDIPRMSPNIPLFRQKVVQDIFERILFIWSVRHPASGYVQGINDLVTPFFIVFLYDILPSGVNIDRIDLETLDQEKRNMVEADSYWCFSKFLAGIQDNYIFPQLGIQHKINQLRELIKRIDGTLHAHLESNGVEYLQFSFRWMNNLLTRELPLRCLIRLWDTYLSELDTFATFQLFVCAAFLLYWRDDLLLKKDFQGLMLMLQNLPTQHWSDTEINILVAEAYRLKCTFADAPNHFQTKGS